MAEPNYKELARQCRLKVLAMVHSASTSHIASNFSCIDFATVLYENLKPEDKVVWSAGWKAATAYYFLVHQGFIPKEDLDLFGKEIDGKIPYLGLLETTTPGVQGNFGSMGHGLPIACGMALAKKLKGEAGNIYCILSDGEMQEGTTWETAQIASTNNLDNLIVIIDYNKWCAMGRTNEVCNLEPFEQRWKGFNWNVIRIDGHDYREIALALAIRPKYELNKPYTIICDTIKGKGVSFMENHLLYHYHHVSEDDYLKAKLELENA